MEKNTNNQPKCIMEQSGLGEKWEREWNEMLKDLEEYDKHPDYTFDWDVNKPTPEELAEDTWGEDTSLMEECNLPRLTPEEEEEARASEDLDFDWWSEGEGRQHAILFNEQR